MDHPASQPEPALRDDAAGCVRSTVGLLREFGRDELAAALERQGARPDGATPAVVVVGETKRGKSSLVNALLGRPDLSPVDVDVATCVHIVFRYAPVEVVRVRIAGAQEPIEVAVTELAEWAAESGNPGNVKGVTGIEVGLTVDLLRGLTLVDTPGVGGLELGHAELTLQALAAADAILFVVDAGAPITATELAFLRRAAERIDTVAVVLTKIDLYPGWRQIHADNVALLRKHAPRFAGAAMLPISNVNAARAIALGSGPDGRAERSRAGLDGLEQVLTGFVADRARLLGRANTLRFCLRSIAELRDHAQDQLAGAGGDPARSVELVAEQARLAQAAPAEAEWRRTLEANISKLALVRDGELRHRLDELAHDYLELAKKRRTGPELQQLSGQFVSAVDAMTRRLAEETGQQLVSAVTEVIGVLAEDTTLRDSLDRLACAGEASARGYAPATQKRLTGLELFTAVTPMLTIDRLVTMMPSALGVGVVATGPIGIGLGVAAIAVGSGAAMLLAKERKKIAAQNSFTAWLREYVAAVRDGEQRAFAAAMIDTRRELAAALEAGVRRRAAELARDRAQLEHALADTAAQRAQATRAAADRLNRIEALNQHTQALLRSVQGTRESAVAAGAVPGGAVAGGAVPAGTGRRTAAAR